MVRSVVFTTERAREITATTTEEVDATSKPINVTFNKLKVGDVYKLHIPVSSQVVLCQIVVLTACISLCRGEEEIEKYRDCVQGCTDRWRQHFPQCSKISLNFAKFPSMFQNAENTTLSSLASDATTTSKYWWPLSGFERDNNQQRAVKVNACILAQFWKAF